MPQFTKYALENSLKKLLLQKPLNKITINDITEDCGVNRMTFYYHFKDIYDLVDWIIPFFYHGGVYGFEYLFYLNLRLCFYFKILCVT